MGRRKKNAEQIIKPEQIVKPSQSDSVVDAPVFVLKTRQELSHMRNSELVEYQGKIGMKKIRINNSIDRSLAIEKIIRYQKALNNRRVHDAITR